MAFITAQKPPVTLLENAKGKAGADFAPVLVPPQFFVPPASAAGQSRYPKATSIISSAIVSNPTATASAVSVRTVDIGFRAWRGQITEGSGDGSNELWVLGMFGGGIRPGAPPKIYDFAGAPAVVPSSNINSGNVSAWSPDSRYLMTVLVSGSRAYDLSSGTPVVAFTLGGLTADETTGAPRAVAWSADDSWIARGWERGIVEVFDVATRTPQQITLATTSPVRSVDFSPDGRYLVVCQQALNPLTIYDMQTGSPVLASFSITQPANQGRHAIWSPNGRWLAVSHPGTPSLTVYDWISGLPVQTTAPAVTSGAPFGERRGISWSGASRYLAVAGSRSPFVTVYDMDSGTPVAMPDAPLVGIGRGLAVEWSKAADVFALSFEEQRDVLTSSYNRIVFYALSGGTFSRVFPSVVELTTPLALSWSPDGRYLHAVVRFSEGIANVAVDNIVVSSGGGANLVTNHSFEDFTGLTPTSYGFIGTPSGWGIDRLDGQSNVLVRHYTNRKGGLEPAEGVSYIEIGGSSNTDAPITTPEFITRLSQTLTGMTAGQTYDLSIDLALISGGHGAIEVWWGGERVALVDDKGEADPRVTPVQTVPLLTGFPVGAGQSVYLPLSRAMLNNGSEVDFASDGAATLDVSVSYVLTLQSE